VSAFESAAQSPPSAAHAIESAMQPVESAAWAHGVPAPSSESVWSALEDVHDPEIPVLSVVDLGVIRSVTMTDDTIRVELLPTFVGCPAIEIMQERIRERLASFAPRVDVPISFAEPWTSDRISARGREKLRQSGFAPPTGDVGAGGQLIPLVPAASCPFCGSRRTVLENAFGPTLCRSIYYCTACRQPFEQFKTV
jgi:ring-1,2-phenylacetyl-CoA epoxidase subunit PaaD